MTSETQQFREKLHQNGYKATPSRVAVLQILQNAKQPLSPQQVAEKIASQADQATVYRILLTLKDAGLVRHVDLQHGHAHYEIADTHDHHHFICTRCGKVINFEGCNVDQLIARALKKTPGFAEVQQHSLEVFGLCTNCSKK